MGETRALETRRRVDPRKQGLPMSAPKTTERKRLSTIEPTSRRKSIEKKRIEKKRAHQDLNLRRQSTTKQACVIQPFLKRGIVLQSHSSSRREPARRTAAAQAQRMTAGETLHLVALVSAYRCACRLRSRSGS